MSETLPFIEASARLSELADRVERGQERIVVTRGGRPAFVLVSPEDLDALEEAAGRSSGSRAVVRIDRPRRPRPEARRSWLGRAAER